MLKELPYSQIEVDIVNPSAEFARLTPIKKVPVLQDDQFVVHDSLFIAEYLDRAYSDTYPLFPSDLEAKMRACTMISLLERAFTTIAPMVAASAGFFSLGEERAACSGYHAVSSNVEKALLEYFEGQIGYLEQTLDGRRRFVGGRTTQADLAVFAFLHTARQAGLNTSSLADWQSDVESEPPFDAMFECLSDRVIGKM